MKEPSVYDILKTFLPHLEEMRNEIRDQRMVDYYLPDGTKIYSKEQAISQIADYDELILAVKCRIDILESDST